MLIDDISAHLIARLRHLCNLENLVRERRRDEIEREIAEHLEVLKADYYRQWNNRKKKNLIVGESQSEDESRKPEDLVRRLAHPAVGQEKDPHEKKRI